MYTLSYIINIAYSTYVYILNFLLFFPLSPVLQAREANSTTKIMETIHQTHLSRIAAHV